MNSINDWTFKAFCTLLYQNAGLEIGENKRSLLHSKLVRILRQKQLVSFDDYLELLRKPNNRRELQEFINFMTTNTTEFFREKHHFEFITREWDFIRQQNPGIDKLRTVRIWSAACSTGQEPITLAIVLKEALGSEVDIRILATDINSQVLNIAMAATYTQNECQVIPAQYLQKWFIRQGEDWQVNPEIMRLIKYRWFNLMEPFPFKYQFDMIWCRNTLIYFNAQAQQELIDKFCAQLASGGLLFLGHSESLISKRHNLQPVGHSIYIKPGKGRCL